MAPTLSLGFKADLCFYDKSTQQLRQRCEPYSASDGIASASLQILLCIALIRTTRNLMHRFVLLRFICPNTISSLSFSSQ